MSTGCTCDRGVKCDLRHVQNWASVQSGRSTQAAWHMSRDTIDYTCASSDDDMPRQRCRSVDAVGWLFSYVKQRYLRFCVEMRTSGTLSYAGRGAFDTLPEGS